MELFEKREIPNHYKEISHHHHNRSHHKPFENKNLNTKKYHVSTVTLIPEYLSPILKDTKNYIPKTYSQNNLGYAIKISEIESLDSYIKSQFKTNHKVLKRYISRLESCLNIRYKMFYGSIQKDDYDYLMATLKEMLVRRFAQRNDENKKLKEWNLILNNSFDQINAKEASLFGIYDDDKPIDISLNYHYDKIIFSAISSYDIDYHKFGDGHVEMIKLLEWCIKEQYDYLELGYGDLDFKRRWCNYIYNFK